MLYPIASAQTTTTISENYNYDRNKNICINRRQIFMQLYIYSLLIFLNFRQ